MEADVEFTHEELLEITNKTLNSLLTNDSVLSDLPQDVTLEEVSAQLALQHGQSITVFIRREDGETRPVVVHISATVMELKKAIRRHMTLALKRKRINVNINWKYIWKNNVLWFENEKLLNDNAKLVDLGIRNKSILKFIKHHREKNKMKR